MIRRLWAHVLDPPREPTDPTVNRGFLAPPSVLRELGLLAVVGFVQLFGMTMAAQDQEHGPVGVGGYTVLALAVAALPLRHRYPAGVLAATFVLTQIYWAQDTPRGPAMVAFLVAVTHVLLIGRRRVAIAFLVASWLLLVVVRFLVSDSNTESPDLAAVLGSAAWALALVAIVEVVRSRRDRAQQASRSAADAMRRQVADERMRMARDLHDSVAHNMSLISIQAGVALHLLEQGDGESTTAYQPVTQSLSVIKDASKEALVELRSILGVLRHVDADGDERLAAAADGGQTDESSQGGPRMPVPTLDRLGDLLERARSVGVEVRVRVSRADVFDGLPRPVDLAAFRIIQESLTNVSRHSGANAAEIRASEADGALLLEVLDEGPGVGVGRTPLPDVPGGGNGIVGMRERAAAVGGYLRAGPRPGRGFAVLAVLPLEPDAVVSAPADVEQGWTMEQDVR